MSFFKKKIESGVNLKILKIGFGLKTLRCTVILDGLWCTYK